ncbi:MAG: glycoside hydrolase family 36 N-terminal domain-containing protein, partial [Novosphingobium sp.]
MPAALTSLHGDQASLVLECRSNGPPLWRHLGARVAPDALSPLELSRTPASFSLDADVPFSTAPPAGLGWFGPPSLALRRDGKTLIPVFGVADVVQDRTVIRIDLHDAQAAVTLHQTIELLEGGAFRFGAELANVGGGPVEVDWLASALIPLAASSRSLISWRGRHNAELVECAEPMPQQAWRREGRRGISGHGGPPGVIVLDEGASHHTGLVHALQLVWSGDSTIAVERDDEGYWILSAGARFAPGEVVLGPGERIAAPAAILAVSSRGRNGAMAQHHAAVRSMLNWPGGTMRPRPVHLNSWEACYFDHDEARIAALAEAAAAIGVERFVLDDGWFRGRGNDDAGLGDWTADPVKYP